MKITAIIPAAGSGSRYSKDKNKLLENLEGIPVIVRTLQTISDIKEIGKIIICTSSNLTNEIKELVELYKITKIKNIIPGGATRQESVFLGLNSVEADTDFVLIHDAARPLIDKYIVINAIYTSIEKGNIIVAVPAKDTIKRVSNNKVIDTPDRSELWNVQTPQIFNYKQLLSGHEKFKSESFTDDSLIIEKLGLPVYTVMGSYKNIKITTQEDLKVAEALLN